MVIWLNGLCQNWTSRGVSGRHTYKPISIIMLLYNIGALYHVTDTTTNMQSFFSLECWAKIISEVEDLVNETNYVNTQNISVDSINIYSGNSSRNICRK
jgi:hypothetical protein